MNNKDIIIERYKNEIYKQKIIIEQLKYKIYNDKNIKEYYIKKINLLSKL
jgi:hypothetical protein